MSKPPQIPPGPGAEQIVSVKKRINGWVILAIVAVCGLILMPIVMGAKWLGTRIDFGAAAGNLDADVVKAQAAGVPLVASDLNPNPPIKPEDNAAPLLRKAFKDFQASPGMRIVKGSDIYDELNKPGGGAALEMLKPLDPVLAETASAAALPGCDFKFDWDMGPQLLFPEFADFKNLAKIFSLRAEAEAATGDHVSAVRDLETASKLGGFSGNEATLISMLVRIAIEAIVLDSLERCLANAKTKDDVDRYLTFLNAPKTPYDYGRVLKGEAYMGVTAIRNLKTFGNVSGLSGSSSGQNVPPVDPAKLIRSGMPKNLTQRAFMARHLEMWTQIFSEIKPMANDPDKLFEHVGTISETFVQKPGVSYLLEKILAPVYAQAGKAAVRNVAAWRTNQELAKVVKYKMDHGEFPAKLSDAGVTEIDPFNGKPLGYQRKTNSVRVYSVGVDGVDDHGLRRSERGRGSPDGTFDEVACYPPPPRVSFTTRSQVAPPFHPKKSRRSTG